jgi:Ca-activated chloride channel family protein
MSINRVLRMPNRPGVSSRPRARRHHLRQRRGGMIVLVAIMLTVVIILCALAVNMAWIELAQTEMRVVTDNAARTAMVEFGKSADSTAARTAAKNNAKTNSVGGKSYVLQNSDVVFGRAVKQSNNSYTFTANGTPTNAVQIQANMVSTSSMGQLQNLMTGVISPDYVNLQNQSIAVRLDNDIAIVVDRSASMAWDLSGTAYTYPSETGTDAGNDIQFYFTKPHATLSRWAGLCDALDAFQQAVSDRNINAQVGLVTFASDYQFGNSQWQSTKVANDVNLTTNFPSIVTAANNYGTKPLIGGTDIGAGMTNGRNMLISGTGARTNAVKTMIVMTDGNRQSGLTTSEIAAYATTCKNEGITIHTITFSEDAAYSLMQTVANNGGGKHYHSKNFAELRQAFLDIAGSLPVMLIQ